MILKLILKLVKVFTVVVVVKTLIITTVIMLLGVKLTSFLNLCLLVMDNLFLAVLVKVLIITIFVRVASTSGILLILSSIKHV